MYDDDILHIGTPHEGPIPHSGRFKWGSGKNSYQRATQWQDIVAKHRKNGLSDTEIAYKMGITTSEFRRRNTIAKQERRLRDISMIQELHDKGLGSTEISRRLGIAESTVRMNLDKTTQYKVTRMEDFKKDIVDLVDKYEYLDWGLGSAQQMGVTKSYMDNAIKQLIDSGEFYSHKVYVRNATDPTKQNEWKVLTREPDLSVVLANKSKISAPNIYKDENGISRLGLKPIESVEWNRIHIKYDEDGGTDKDGVIQLRPGVTDLDLGKAKYAQVRIAVGDSHYLKGMAVYGDPKDFPKGTDIIFNTNKKRGTAPEDVLKKLKRTEDGKIDMDNPFGATIKPNGQKGAINKVNEEGDWANWSKQLSAQFLSKQPTKLVRERIEDTYNKLVKEHDEIMALNNPVVRSVFLDDFAKSVDKKRYSLKLQGIDGMQGKVLLPLEGIKANQIYAPSFKDGDKVVLIRYPHGGKFELPELTVNNKLGNGPAKFMKGALDAVGIDSSVAVKLSGADFDGDSVMVVPNNHGKIKTERSLKELKNFDTKSYYTPTPPKINTNREMGVVSNLITDMTIKGASQSEIARAVKHSMVVIDAEKHSLDYKRSERENNIPALKKAYQTHTDIISGKTKKGASTLISRSRTDYDQLESYFVERTKEELAANPRLAPKIKKQKRVSSTPVIDMVDDAKKIGSGTPVENLYGNYINKLTKLRDKSNKELSDIPKLKMNKDAKVKYKDQVASLNDKLTKALMNVPAERQAQLMAEQTILERRTPNMSKGDLKKLRQQAITAARQAYNVDGKSARIKIDNDEWNAIQSGAISDQKLRDIMRFADRDQLRALATPRQTSLTLSQASRIKSLLNSGKTYSEIADAVGVSVSTVQRLSQ